MTVLSLQEAVERTGTSKIDIWRAIQAGALSAKKTDDGGFEIEPDDLFAVFETKQVDQPQDAASAVEASESPETSARPNTVETELKGVLELSAQAAAERAKIEKTAVYAAPAKEHDEPWWRRLVGWIRTRRGRAARQRLRERL